MTGAALDIAIGTPPPAPPARPRMLLIGTSLAIGATVFGLAGILAVYISQRAELLADGAGGKVANSTWYTKVSSVIPTTPGNVAIITLAMSLVTMQWALWALKHDDRPRAYMAMGITFMLGLAYINGIAFTFTQMDLTVHELPGLLVIVLLGAHLAMAGAGLIFLGLMAFRSLGGQYSGRDREGVTAAALYWYATVAAFAVIWLLVFIEK